MFSDMWEQLPFGFRVFFVLSAGAAVATTVLTIAALVKFISQ